MCLCRYFVSSNLVEPYSLTEFSLSAFFLLQSFWKKYGLKFCVFKSLLSRLEIIGPEKARI